jgi:hypothetical protein
MFGHALVSRSIVVIVIYISINDFVVILWFQALVSGLSEDSLWNFGIELLKSTKKSTNKSNLFASLFFTL